MVFTFEFFRIRPSDNAHATLDRVLQNVPDLDAAKVRAQSMFENMDLPQKPNGFRMDEGGTEVFANIESRDAGCYSVRRCAKPPLTH